MAELFEMKQKIAEKILDELKLKGLSQVALGELCNMNRSNVNNALKLHGNANHFSLSKYIEMALALDLEVELKITRKK